MNLIRWLIGQLRGLLKEIQAAESEPRAKEPIVREAARRAAGERAPPGVVAPADLAASLHRPLQPTRPPDCPICAGKGYLVIKAAELLLIGVASPEDEIAWCEFCLVIKAAELLLIGVASPEDEIVWCEFCGGTGALPAAVAAGLGPLDSAGDHDEAACPLCRSARAVRRAVMERGN